MLLAGCGGAHADDLADIRAARSLAAEAAQIVRLERQHRVTSIYASRMKDSAREELSSEVQSATVPKVKALARQAIAALHRNDAPSLQRIAQQLLAMEGPHGRAD